MTNSNQPLFILWVGGVEIIDTPISKEKVEEIKAQYIADGYDDVVIEEFQK